MTAVCLASTVRTDGGVWRHVRDLAEGLREAGAEVSLAVPTAATALVADARARGFAVNDPTARPTVHHLHLADTYDRAGLLATLAARRAGRRVVISEHLPRTDASDAHLAGRPPRRLARPAKTTFKTLQYGLADQVVALSTGSAAFLRARYPRVAHRVTTVFNGVEVGPEPAVVAREPGPARFLVVGAVINQKGHDLVVDAARHARGDWTVDVCGDGPHRARLAAEAASLTRADGSPRIRFLGWTDDVPARLAAADALVMPSRWEAMPYSVLEAMAAARPVVGFAVDGLTDQVLDGVTGHLVHGDGTYLAAALDTFDVEAGPALGRAGRVRVRDHFSRAAMVEQTLAVYDRGRVPARSLS